LGDFGGGKTVDGLGGGDVAKIRLEIELEYDENIMHGDDPQAIEWFFEDILQDQNGELLLHSNEIGDTIGTVRVTRLTTTLNLPGLGKSADNSI